MREIRGLLLVLLLLFLATFVPDCSALPELTISNLFFSKDYPESNEVFTISATVHNSGNSYSEPIFAEHTGPISYFVKISSSNWGAQSFQYGEDVNLAGVSLHIKDIGVDDSLTVRLETDLSTHAPSGTLVVETASTTINGGGEGWDWVDFMFSSLVPLLSNTTYWIVTQSSAGSSDGYSVIVTSNNLYATGINAYSSNEGETWTEYLAYDLLFKAYRSTRTVVNFYDGDPDSGGILIGTDEISPVPASGDITASLSTSTSAGYHTIYAWINSDNYIVEDSTTNNRNSKTIAVDCPRIVTAYTVDDDLNGGIDAYHIVFNENIDDSTLEISGFGVEGYGGLQVLTALANHPDEIDDDDIYLCFTEKSIGTAVLPEITYSSSTGELKDLDDGVPLLDVTTSMVSEQDGAAPIIHSATAPDYSGEDPGIEAGDRIVLLFSEAVSGPPNINSTNIDEVLITTGSFRDGNGFIGSTVWSEGNSELTIYLSVGGGSPTVFPGYTIATDTFTFRDASGNVSSHTVVLGGDLDITPPRIVSTSPASKDNGVSVDRSIKINFNERMNAANVVEAIIVEEIRDKDGNDIDPPKVVAGAVSYNPDTFSLAFVPTFKLKNNFRYRIRITQVATDIIGHHLTPFEFTFTTIASYREFNTFVSDDGKLKITLDAGALKENFFVQVNASPLNDSTRKKSIIDANKKLDMDDDPFSFTVEPTIVEIEAFDAQGNPITGPFGIPAAIALLYEDSNPEDGIVDETSPPVREETLAAYWLNEKNSLWVKLTDSAVDRKSNIVTTRTFHFSVFSLHGAGTTDLSDAYAYPVPFIPSRGDSTITFTNISPACKIKIYTLSGELATTIEHTTGETSYPWNVTNDRGDRLGSGVYLYIIKNEKYSKKGKLIIIR